MSLNFGLNKSAAQRLSEPARRYASVSLKRWAAVEGKVEQAQRET